VKDKKGEDVTLGDEEEADRINANDQPDWEELGAIREEIAKLQKDAPPDLVESLRQRARDAIPEDRPELLAEIEALLVS